MLCCDDALVCTPLPPLSASSTSVGCTHIGVCIAHPSAPIKYADIRKYDVDVIGHCIVDFKGAQRNMTLLVTRTFVFWYPQRERK